MPRRNTVHCTDRFCSITQSEFLWQLELLVGVNGYHKLELWLDKKYNSLALIGRELLSCISCPIRRRVVNITVHPYHQYSSQRSNSPLATHQRKSPLWNSQQIIKTNQQIQQTSPHLRQVLPSNIKRHFSQMQQGQHGQGDKVGLYTHLFEILGLYKVCILYERSVFCQNG